MALRPRPADLAALCRDLRAAGLGVDLRHELRLAAVLARSGPVDAARLRRLVAAVVLADRDQRPVLEAALETWLPGLPEVAGGVGDPAAAEPAEEDPPAAQGTAQETVRETPPGRILGIILGLLALGGLLLWALAPGEPAARDAGPPDAAAADAGAPDAKPEAVPAPTGSLPVPSVAYEPVHRAPPPAAGPLMVFGALALLGLLLARRRRDPALPPAEGPPAAPPPPAPLAPALSAWTDPADRRHMVFGVEHFQSEAPTRRLDLRASVQATARAGARPVVRLRRRRLPRTVWLWIDALAHPDAEALARQLHQDLRRANLDARLAWTFGGPDRLVLDLPGQPELPVDHLDTPPEGCVVVWCTDGHGLDREGPAERARALRQLRAWPRLALARCGPAAGDLAAHARGLSVLDPEAVAAWIGKGQRALAPRAVDLSLWQAAAALAPAPADADTLLALGDALGYPQPRAHLAALLADAQPVGPRWTWPAAVAAPRLSWLARQPELARALAFWRAHHAPPPGDAATPTARARALDQALLDLWDAPERAARALLRLVDPLHAGPEPAPRAGGLRRAGPPRGGPAPSTASALARARATLRGLTPADGAPPAGARPARLPWRFAALSPEARRCLAALGLAGVAAPPPRRLAPRWRWPRLAELRPGALWAGLDRRRRWAALLAGALFGLGLALRLGATPPLPGAEVDLAPEPEARGERPPGARLERGPAGGWVAILRGGSRLDLPHRRGERAILTWDGARAPCAEPFGPGALWRCLDGPPVAPPADPRWPASLVIAVDAPADDPAARRLARALLARGGADLVVLRPWPWSRAQAGGVALLDPSHAFGGPLEDPRSVILVRRANCARAHTGLYRPPHCVEGDLDKLTAALGETAGAQVLPLFEVWPPPPPLGLNAASMIGGPPMGEATAVLLGHPRRPDPPPDQQRGQQQIVDPGDLDDLNAAAACPSLDEDEACIGGPPDVLYFGRDRSDLPQHQRPKLAALVERLRAEPTARLTLEGHYGEGTEEMAQARSQRRALAVQKALVAAGAPAERLRTVSLGKGRLVHPEPGNPGEAALNHRVTLRWEDLRPVLAWVRLPAGTFRMGSERGDADERPVRAVTVRAFELGKTEVTVAEYRACVEAKVCSEPGKSAGCNWGQDGRDGHPINCVSWDQAQAFAGWMGARLPSEAEWEYAARSGGRNIEYPWGDEKADCERAVMRGGGVNGCGQSRSWPVCSKPSGNSAQGVCDLAGNVWEWVEDSYGPYRDSPADGSARFDKAARDRVNRGGSWRNTSGYLRAHRRSGNLPGRSNLILGFRLARSTP